MSADQARAAAVDDDLHCLLRRLHADRTDVIRRMAAGEVGFESMLATIHTCIAAVIAEQAGDVPANPAQARLVVVDALDAPIVLWVYEGAVGRPVAIDDGRALALAADLLNAVRRRAETFPTMERK